MIKRINNEREFLQALNRVDALMFHAVPGTPEGDELEKLSKMIEEYENRNAIVMSQSKVGDDIINSIKNKFFNCKYNLVIFIYILTGI